MRSYDTATGNYFSGQSDIVAKVLLWITAKDRGTGAAQTVGIWTGDDHANITIGGSSRLYYGAGAMLNLPSITYTLGFGIQTQMADLSSLAPEVINAIRVYDPRFAPVEVHRALYNASDRSLVSEPHRVFKGWIDSVSITTPEIGGDGKVSLTMVSAARALTRSVAQMKSDETQKRRSGDRFRKWNAISGAVEVSWGEKRAKAHGDGSAAGGGANGGTGGQHSGGGDGFGSGGFDQGGR